jgi:hypothetical protein
MARSQRELIAVLVPDPTKKKQRAVLLAALFAYNKHLEHDGIQEAWVWSIIENTYPGIMDALFSSNLDVNNRSVVVKKIHLTKDQFDFLNNDFAPKKDTGIFIPQFPQIFPLSAETEPVYMECVSLAVIFMWTLGKTPTADNYPAFKVNRVRALTGKAGLTPGQHSVLAEKNFPSVATLVRFIGYFNLNIRLREPFAKELLSWSGRNADTPEKELAVSQISLWEDAGLGHVALIKLLLIGYGEALLNIRPLHAEIHKFCTDLVSFTTAIQHDGTIAFGRVITGGNQGFMPSKGYSELLGIARAVFAKRDKRFTQYAKGLKQPVFWDEFIEECDTLNLIVPDERVTPVVPVVVGSD